MGWGLAAVTRSLALCLLAAMFVTDYMFDLWAKGVPREAYLLVASIALGVDVTFLRDILINALTKALGGGGKRGDE